MKKYKYFIKGDFKKEPVGYIEAKSLQEAIIKSYTQKNLKPSLFLLIFEVEEIKK